MGGIYNCLQGLCTKVQYNISDHTYNIYYNKNNLIADIILLEKQSSLNMPTGQWNVQTISTAIPMNYMLIDILTPMSYVSNIPRPWLHL